MKYYLVITTILVLSACAGNSRISSVESEGNLAESNPLPCIPANSVQNTNTPPDIAAGARSCAAKGNYDQSAELIMVASAFAFYDTQRVADKSAHGALTGVFSQNFMALSEPDRKKLFSSINTLDDDKSRKDQLCSFLSASLPPNYMPNYMIKHGMKQFTGNNEEPLIGDFNSKQSWSKAIEFVKCSS